MVHNPCAGLITALEKRIRAGQMIALACWCETVLDCHRGLIGHEMDRRGVLVEWD
jgi:hypothetical protein